MAYSEIFTEIYTENKKEIRIYIMFALAFSILAFSSGNVVYATATLGTAGTIMALGGQGGAILAPIVKAVPINFDVSSGLAIVSAVSILFDIVPQDFLTNVGIPTYLIESSFGLLDVWAIRILCFVWFIVGKLPRTNRISYSTGLVLEYIETKCGKWIQALIVFSDYYANFSSALPVQASSSTDTSLVIDTATTFFSAFTCFFILVSLLVIYLLIRTFFFFISIILIPFCTVVPFSALVIELLKIGLIICLEGIALVNQNLFWIIYALVLVLSIFFFKKAYITVRYFKNIYVRPFFKKFRGYDHKIPLCTKKYPRKIRNYIENEEVAILMPVYLIKKIPYHEYTYRHDKWWLVSSETKQYICKPCFMNNSCYVIELNNTEDKKVYIQQSLRFFEIFTLENEKDIGKTFRRIHKKIHIVFSKEYLYRFQNIKEITGFVDYTEYCKEMKQEKKFSRKEQREGKWKIIKNKGNAN
ncbi:MAG: hypothetical protein IKW30_01755 [Lachnospiraceae bacterium]|nr:hypothetical protein [Lachnospiraceae bacterium]